MYRQWAGPVKRWDLCEHQTPGWVFPHPVHWGEKTFARGKWSLFSACASLFIISRCLSLKYQYAIFGMLRKWNRLGDYRWLVWSAWKRKVKLLDCGSCHFIRNPVRCSRKRNRDVLLRLPIAYLYKELRTSLQTRPEWWWGMTQSSWFKSPLHAAPSLCFICCQGA